MKIEEVGSDETKAISTKRKAEPSSEKVANFSRVTPAQLGYIGFPSEGRYQPVRPVSLHAQATKGGRATGGNKKGNGSSGLLSERYAGGGGILILVDERPDEEAELIDLSPRVVVEATGNGSAVPNPSERNLHIALDESTGDAEPPASFEVSGPTLMGSTSADQVTSTRSRRIHKQYIHVPVHRGHVTECDCDCVTG